MIIQTNSVPKGFDAYTIWPIILIKPSCFNNKPLIAHEMVHYIEQRNCGVLPWLLAYAFSDQFRLNAEVRGYRKQIELKGVTIDQAADYLMADYDLLTSRPEVIAKLQAP